MRYCFIAFMLFAFSCTKDNNPETTPEPLKTTFISTSTIPNLPAIYDEWILSSSSRLLVSGDPQPYGSSGGFVTRYEDSIQYDRQFQVTNTYLSAYNGDVMLGNSDNAYSVSGETLVISLNGKANPTATIDPKTKSILFQPNNTVTSVATNGMTDTLVSGFTTYTYDQLNFCTRVSNQNFRVRNTTQGTNTIRWRHDDNKQNIFHIENGLMLLEEEILKTTDSFFSRPNAQTPYRLDSIKTTANKTLERQFTYDTTLGIVDPVLPYNRGKIPGYTKSSITLLKNTSTQPGEWKPVTLGTSTFSYVFRDGLLIEKTEQITENSGKTRTWRTTYRYKKRI